MHPISRPVLRLMIATALYAALSPALAQPAIADDPYLWLEDVQGERALAFHHASEELEGIEPFAGLSVLASLRPSDIDARRHRLIADDNLCVALAHRR